MIESEDGVEDPSFVHTIHSSRQFQIGETQEDSYLKLRQNRNMPSSVSTVESSSSDEAEDDSPLLADSYLAGFDNGVNSTSTSDDEDEDVIPSLSLNESSGVNFDSSYSSKFVNSPEFSNKARKTDETANSSEAQQNVNNLYRACSTDEMDIMFLRSLGINPNEKSDPYPNIRRASQSHVRIQQIEKELVDLKTQSMSAKKKDDVGLFGYFFRKMSVWASNDGDVELTPESKSKAEIESANTESELLKVTSPQNIQSIESNGSSPLASPSSSSPAIPELGLKRGCVTRLENYDRELRKRAQISMLDGKRNVAFIDKVEVLSIRNRRNFPKEIKNRMFHTRKQFVEMVANNMKEIEVEARRNQRKKHRRQKTLNL